MTTSGTAIFTQNINQIILRAGRQVGAWEAGETPSALEVADWTVAANAMVKEWQATGLHLWAEQEGILFPQPGQISYAIGAGSADQVSNAALTAQTSLSANEAVGAASINVASIAGMGPGYQIGVYLDAGSIFWTTVQGAPANGVANIAADLPSSASSGNVVFCYPSNIDRPLRCLAVRRYNSASKIDTPINLIARLDFRDLPNKSDTGLINQVFYDPQLAQGVMWVWQAPVDSSYLVKFTFMRQLQDFATQVNTPDFPQEWINCITWNLADQMKVEYGCPQLRSAEIEKKAARSLDICTGFDREPESIFAGVSFDGPTR